MNCHPDSGVSSYFSYSSSASSASTSLRDSFLLTTQSSLIAILACIIWIIAAFSHNGRAHAEMPIPDRDPAAGLEREENRGSLIIMGGSERFDNRIIWAEIVKKAGGEGSRIAVFPTASGAPMVDGEDVVRVLKDLGADAFLVPLAIRGFENDYREVARDPAMVASVRQSQGVFFVGGEQARIRQALVSPEGDNTPLLEAVWSVYREGGVIAGYECGSGRDEPHYVS